MNYGYDHTTPGFRADRMGPLAVRLRAVLAKYQPTVGRPAYIEIDEAHPEHSVYLYAGVRIRRLTHYGDDDLDAILADADAAFEDVMLGGG